MATRNIPKPASPSSSMSDIGTPEPILEWWPVKYSLKLVRKFVSYEIRSYVHKILYPVRLIIFLSGWPLVYFLRIARYVFYGLYQACEFGYNHLSKKPPTVSSPTLPRSPVSQTYPNTRAGGDYRFNKYD